MSGRLALTLVVVLAIAACAGPSVSPSPAATVVASPSPAATVAPAPPTATVALASPTAALPVRFSSPLYGYEIVVPAGWAIGPAMLRWDAASAPSADANTVDKFVTPSGMSVFAYAGPTTLDMAGFVDAYNAWTVRDHGTTCHFSAPEKTEPIEIDGQPATLLLWDCGILINVAVVVRDDVAFVLVMRDPRVRSTTDPADRAILDALLASVVFAGT